MKPFGVPIFFSLCLGVHDFILSECHRLPIDFMIINKLQNFEVIEQYPTYVYTNFITVA